MTDPRAIESAKQCMAKNFSRKELEALRRDSAAITADYALLVCASLKADGCFREEWAADFLAQIIEAGLNARKGIAEKLGRMGSDGSEYSIEEECE